MRQKGLSLWIILAGAFAALVGLAGTLYAQASADWTERFLRSASRESLLLGSKGLANYLITTSQGHILINSDLEANVPLIRASVEKLGFKFTDIKILLISHAHWDHKRWQLRHQRRLTGAKYMVMAADVASSNRGARLTFSMATWRHFSIRRQR